jgi:hypothetical protein
VRSVECTVLFALHGEANAHFGALGTLDLQFFSKFLRRHAFKLGGGEKGTHAACLRMLTINLVSIGNL